MKKVKFFLYYFCPKSKQNEKFYKFFPESKHLETGKCFSVFNSCEEKKQRKKIKKIQTKNLTDFFLNQHTLNREYVLQSSIPARKNTREKNLKRSNRNF